VSSIEFILASRRVATAEGVLPAWLHVRGGRIRAVGAGAPPDALPVLDVGERAVLPGLVDAHVHVNEPGRSEWEGFAAATAAAASGGVTTILDMPLNAIPPTTTTEAFGAKLESAAGRCRVHVGFWGGLVPGNAPELAHLAAAGVFGFKCFLSDSGVPEFGAVGESELAAGMEEIARLDALLLVHAEWGPLVTSPAGPTRSYAAYLKSRPRAAESEAISRVLALCRKFGTRVHVVHLSSADALDQIERARAEGLHVTAETCPHYLALAAEEVADGATEFKCAPPIREHENRERLWKGLATGALDMVVSDHSPAPAPLKEKASGDFGRAWGGIASLGLALPVVWTEARRRGHSLSELARWMSAAPARLARLDPWKGSLAVGQDADFLIFDPEAEWTVEAGRLRHRHKVSPYVGKRLAGLVVATYLKGEKIYEAGSDLGVPAGELLLSC
jgi:allantoinase